MKRFTQFLFTILAIIIIILHSSTAYAVERADEIRAEMWNSANKNFQVTEVPKKWLSKSAVIIAQLNRYEYRKPVILSLLRYNEYNHYRIKLLDKNAINKYSEMSYYNNRTDNATGESIKVYVGFKVIKPNGKEIIVDLASAVTMEKETRGQGQSYNKLAIPNLEVGDILDYYICEEAMKSNSGIIYFFDPVIYHFPREYPVMEHKLQFRAERKCYINIKALNGAPEVKTEIDESNEEKYFTFEAKDIEPAEDQRWLFPYRELPTIKFRAAYASGKAMRNYDVLLGEPGEVKSSVTKDELEKMVGTMMAGVVDISSLTAFAKKKLKDEKDPLEIARQVYYFHRNNDFNLAEASVVEGKAMPEMREIAFTDLFHTFFVKMKIQHDVILAVPQRISSIDNVLMEDEIDWLIRVRNGDQELYLSPFDMNTEPGVIDVSLQGTDAYALDGMAKVWSIKPIKLPITKPNDNRTEWQLSVNLTDLNTAKVGVKKILTGRNKLYDQYTIMDIYDFEAEERSNGNYKMTETFAGFSFYKKKYLALKEAYMASRDKNRQDLLKESVEGTFKFKVKEVGNLTIDQTGRYHTASAMVYRYTFETEDLVKKTGANYLIDAGKLIENQTKIEADELNRKTNIYFDYPRSFTYKIEIEIPKGYTVQGLDKLTSKVENKLGGFTSTAKEVGGKIVIETNKHYDVSYATKDQWNLIVAYLNAASNFSEQKILLKKK